jgi:hypothetical protein
MIHTDAVKYVSSRWQTWPRERVDDFSSCPEYGHVEEVFFFASRRTLNPFPWSIDKINLALFVLSQIIKWRQIHCALPANFTLFTQNEDRWMMANGPKVDPCLCFALSEICCQC